MREFLAICLRRAGHQVTPPKRCRRRRALDKEPFDVVVTDLKMPGEIDGIGLLKAIKAKELRSRPRSSS